MVKGKRMLDAIAEQKEHIFVTMRIVEQIRVRCPRVSNKVVV